MLAFVKIAVLGSILLYGSYWAGTWQGEELGYRKRDSEIAEVTKAKNRQIDELNAQLSAAHDELELSRGEVVKEVASSLASTPASLRRMCATKCSLPVEAKKKIEAIR